MICLPRWATPRTDRPTFGHELALIAERGFGMQLLPWQRQVFDTAFECDADGELVYRTVTITVPRQSGKSLAVLLTIVHRLTMMAARLGPRLEEIGRPDQTQRAFYSAQTGRDAREKLIDEWAPMVSMSKVISPLVSAVRKSNGSELIGFADPSGRNRYPGVLRALANTLESGHGRVTDLGIIDEAFTDVDDRREQALLPGMNTRLSPQLWVVSTAGHEASAFLRRRVELGRYQVEQGMTDTGCYFEWSAAEDADLDDEAVWRGCMPALDRTTPLAAIKAARASMTDQEFRRAYLNQWVSGNEAVIPLAKWLRCLSPSAAPKDPVTFAVDANPHRTHATIAASDGITVEMIRNYEDGLDSVVGDIVKLAGDGNSRVVIDKGSPIASKILELEATGVRVVALDYPEVRSACAELFDAIMNHTVAVVPADALTTSVEGARKKKVSDQFTWSRNVPKCDLTPLNAVTFARWGALHHGSGGLWAF